MSSNPNVVSAIRAEIGRQGTNIATVAREMEKSPSWLWKRLNGDTAITVNDLALIAAALGVSVHDLLPADERAAS